MIPVIYKKPNFLNTLQYVLGKEDAAIIQTNMAGRTPDEFNQQFLNTKYSNKLVKRQCTHLIISIAHRDNYHEHLFDSQYSQVAQEYLKDMGYLPKNESITEAESQYVAVRHHDRDHEHLHIIASRIRLDGSVVSDSYDYFNSQVSTRRIAAEIGLEVTPTTNEAVANRLKQEYGINAPTSPNRSKSIRAVNSKYKTPTSKDIIREAIKEAIKDSPSASTFIQHLEENNIAVLPKIRKDELLGFTYIHNNVKLAGDQVYKPYSWNKLQSEYGLTFDYRRDIDVLKQAKTKSIEIIRSGVASKDSYTKEPFDDSCALRQYSGENKPASGTNDSSSDTDSSPSTMYSTEILNSQDTDNLLLEITPKAALVSGESKTKKKSQSSTGKQESQEYLPQADKSEMEVQLKISQTIPAIIEVKNEKNEELRQQQRSPQVSTQENSSLYATCDNALNPTVGATTEDKRATHYGSNAVTSLPASIRYLPEIIINYMLATNSPRINGRELSANLDGKTLTICRHGENIPVMQAEYQEGNWYEKIPNKLTKNEIEQIESLRLLAQKQLISKSYGDLQKTEKLEK